uniref:Uncharacterized protein n=1 Tax=Anguilla anguilla TaxID=7936 RepID=A0A0E9R637_ANGAN
MQNQRVQMATQVMIINRCEAIGSVHGNIPCSQTPHLAVHPAPPHSESEEC